MTPHIYTHIDYTHIDYTNIDHNIDQKDQEFIKQPRNN